MNPDGLLSNLNPSQQAAVSSFADTLAILAGPGSGKTHTLTSRTAWLLAQGLQPWNIIVATFTVKAAREMKERIGKLLGNGLESKLILGTFHSIARRYLARYGHLIGIKKDFGIADTADSLAIIKRICKRHHLNIDPKVARSRISGTKARAEKEHEENKSGAKTVDAQEFELCCAEYEAALQRSNLLDYDDLLLRCVDLLRNHPSCVSNVEAVLIDEFQDTNIVQFDLMRLFAAERKRITIVGDPDQSIYGFRAAEIKNYRRMLRQYPDTVTIALEENYRSSGAILHMALSIIQQDDSRVAKSLTATHMVGTRPVLRRLAGAYKEAEWIVTEIQRCMGMTGGLMDSNDIAILLRSASLSRLIETALGRAGIAYRMVGGLRFYDRLEIKTILDYLRVINQPDSNDALARIINTPSRRIGDATIKSLLEEADQAKITLWALILGIVKDTRKPTTKIQKVTEHGLTKLVDMVLTARKKLSAPAEERISTVKLINFVLEKTNYEQWLEERQGDAHKARWDNVQELITQANDFQDLLSCGYEDETLPEIDGLMQEEDEDHLSRFLANVALASSEARAEDDEGVPTAQVTISTIHAAKGLEWPVVFIPATYQGSIPHSRAEDTNEERRLLYVAMTRAKALLYMSYPLKNSQGEQTILSPFLAPPGIAPLIDMRGPALGSSTVQSVSQILRRSCPSPASISESRSFLRSSEDDLFPVDGEEDSDNVESRWRNEHTTGNRTHMIGQQPPKRRKIELDRSVSNPEERYECSWKPSYITTMDRASSFTSTTIPGKTEFVNVRANLQVLQEQSVKTAAATIEKETVSRRQPPQNPAVKKKAKALVGQGTLFGFLGKPEPAEEPPLPSLRVTLSNEIKTNPYAQVMPSSFSRPRPNPAQQDVIGIDPSLANRRIGPSAGHRPYQKLPLQQKRNDYVFLSSPPQKPKPPLLEEDVVAEKPPGLTSNPPLLPLIRAATTFHSTTVSEVGTSKKTYGINRKMDGWSSKNRQAFRPPTMKRPG
ncbi:ATP-dependent DNA helicase [Lachnellula hyalina]|uniref:DNA 3'-5' helicase n=1 Tax=Lachnellula hyalina TaxID=1316788 RepID=A0A8H8U283_9HELO|nr:ATP-dependent DNA helicase [Lachnellula hyalina]TVY28687.1 ATP-dependent DNA helicase [Lachnellula hyalina]